MLKRFKMTPPTISQPVANSTRGFSRPRLVKRISIGMMTPKDISIQYKVLCSPGTVKYTVAPRAIRS